MTHSSEEEMQTDSPAEEEMDDLEDEEEDPSSPSLDRSTPSLSLPRTPPAASRHLNLASSASRGTFGSADNTQQTLLSAAELSPPDSQPRMRGTTRGSNPLHATTSSHAALAAASGSSQIFNSNGKRPLVPTAAEVAMLEATQDADDTKRDGDRRDGNGNGEKQGPGSTWKTKRGAEEIGRAMDVIADREYMVGKMYGDVLDVSHDDRLLKVYEKMLS